MALFAGKLDRRITIQRATVTRDEYNAEVSTWATMANVWAAYEPIKDGERFRAGERAAELSARFQIRYSSQVAGVTAEDRLTFDGKTYEIINVKEIGRREGIELTTVARGDG
ncbi:MAG: head-tail adaptor protein [Brevundimonas sp.]|nr:MAG: head-tail adaptor protein [Brevundimonas sp.]